MSQAKLPKPTEPEYKTWSLEKLQNEYFKTKMTQSAQAIELAEMRHKIEKVQDFLEAFNSLREIEA